jgi:beta-xylosidase
VGALVLVFVGLALVLTSRPPVPVNPVHSGNFPDPFILHSRGTYYAYGTNEADNVQLLESSDLVRWRRLPDPLPELPPWAARGRTWAPSVLEREGRWVLYFSAHRAASGRQCIGRAVAEHPAGPFLDDGGGPLVCEAGARAGEDLGAIDPSPFVDRDGTPYLLWSECCKPPTRIWSQRLTNDGLALTGSPQALLQADQPWEEPLVEAPSMLQEAGRYHLLYSGNRWQGERYAIGAAECDGPLGPCRKPHASPLLASQGAMAGPGGQEFFRDRYGEPWIAYHSWTPPLTSYASGGVRSLRVDRVEIKDGVLQIPAGSGRARSSGTHAPARP